MVSLGCIQLKEEQIPDVVLENATRKFEKIKESGGLDRLNNDERNMYYSDLVVECMIAYINLDLAEINDISNKYQRELKKELTELKYGRLVEVIS